MKLKKYFFLTFASLILLKFSAQQYNGLTLVSVYGQSVITLVDTNSVVVKTWTLNGPNGYSSYLTPGGTLWRTVIEPPVVTPTFGGMTGQIQKIDYNGNVLWQYSYNSPTGILHHDFVTLPNGNVLCTAYDVKTGTTIAAGGSTSTETVLMSERIIELQPVGTNSANIVWEWKMWDHLCQNTNSLAANYYPSIVNKPELFDINYLAQTDFVHMNGIDYNPVLDQIVFSSRYRSEWYVIDHSTNTTEAASHIGGNAGKGGDILYRWGNPQVYQATGTQICNVTHDPHWILEGVPNEGYLAGFNNAGQAVPLRSTIDRINPPRNNYTYSITLGSAFTPTIYNSRYVTTAYNIITGCSEQYPNGNQAITLGTSGVIYEVDALGNILWSYNTGGITAQSHRYAPCYTVSPALTQPVVSVNGASLMSSSATSYQWYYNGNAVSGATNQAFVPSPGQNGIYLVRIKDVNACASYYSQDLLFNPPPLSLSELNTFENDIQIYPNPSSGIFNINTNQITENYILEVYDMQGKLMLNEKNKSTINLNHCDAGIYFLQLTSDKNRFCKKISLNK